MSIEYPPIRELIKMTPEELLELGLKKDSQGKLRTAQGHYIPGQSGRLKKPKKVPMTKELSELIPLEIRKKYDDNPLLCMQEMLKLASTKAEAVRISKELLPYTHPKLSSIEQKTLNFQAGNIEVYWEDDDGKHISREDLRDESCKDITEVLPENPEDS